MGVLSDISYVNRLMCSKLCAGHLNHLSEFSVVRIGMNKVIGDI